MLPWLIRSLPPRHFGIPLQPLSSKSKTIHVGYDICTNLSDKMSTSRLSCPVDSSLPRRCSGTLWSYVVRHHSTYSDTTQGLPVYLATAILSHLTLCYTLFVVDFPRLINRYLERVVLQNPVVFLCS